MLQLGRRLQPQQMGCPTLLKREAWMDLPREQMQMDCQPQQLPLQQWERPVVRLTVRGRWALRSAAK